MPINRYADHLRRNGEIDKYFELLKKSFNKNNLDNLMCKDTLSISWDGKIYDCDFNQQIKLQSNKGPKTIFDLIKETYNFSQDIAVNNHCFACTAGAGSSCGGTLT